MTLNRLEKSVVPDPLYIPTNLPCPLQRLCREVATWNALRHPNVLPLLGVTMSNDQFAVVSVWMQNGNINKFVEAFVDVDRLKLVCLSFEILISARHRQ